jgi:hypothetical protein
MDQIHFLPSDFPFDSLPTTVTAARPYFQWNSRHRLVSQVNQVYLAACVPGAHDQREMMFPLVCLTEFE